MRENKNRRHALLLALMLGACGSEGDAKAPSADNPGDDTDDTGDTGDGDSTEPPPSDDPDGGGPGDQAGDGDADQEETAGDGDVGDGDDDSCPEALRSIYLVDAESKLWKLDPNEDDPQSSALTEVGTLDCDEGMLDMARGLAVDSKGRAWVLMGDFTRTPWQERLYTVDLGTAKCGATDYETGDAGKDPAGGSEGPYGLGVLKEPDGERLLMNVQARAPFKVMKLDPETWQGSELIASLLPPDDPQANAGGQLFGTGDGKLYGAFWQTPARIEEIDVATGARSGGFDIGAEEIHGFRTYRDIAAAASSKGFWVFHVGADYMSTSAHYLAHSDGARKDFTLTPVILAAGAAPCASR